MPVSFWERLKFLIRPGAPPPGSRLEGQVQELRATVKGLDETLASILKELAARPPDLHIERLLVDRVNLEQLVFNIDDIGVKDLSGALSIGVNYGGRVTRVTAAPPPHGVKGRPGVGEKTRVRLHFRE